MAHRAITMQRTFEYLDKLTDPLIIVETGSLRTKNNWSGDGQSTILFDKYAQHRQGCIVYTVDIDPETSRQCEQLVSHRVSVNTGDAVVFLHQLASNNQDPELSWCFYLDAFDVDWGNPYPAAAHHMKELMAIGSLLRKDTLVVIDDSPAHPRGKGFIIHDYAKAIGATTLFHEYQLGITGWH